MKRKWWMDRQAVSPAEAIARRVRTRQAEAERRVLAGRAWAVQSMADEVEALKAKAAAEHPFDALAQAVEEAERDIERANRGVPRDVWMTEETKAALLKLAT